MDNAHKTQPSTHQQSRGGLNCKAGRNAAPTCLTHPLLLQVFMSSSALTCLFVIKAYDTGQNLECLKRHGDWNYCLSTLSVPETCCCFTLCFVNSCQNQQAQVKCIQVLPTVIVISRTTFSVDGVMKSSNDDLISST
ncbi:hypothetical protein XENORESO_020079 [Xenotaenia resolanae]|uniref:Uncharacterized protein n=1 Tax=Xenotaenia resolanae TaxID=208358 RepID=A0ABV0WIQ9_9TELE